MLLFSDEYEILYPQYLLEGNGLFKMRLFAILFVYNNTYNISNIINEDINGEPINLACHRRLVDAIKLFGKFYGTLFQITSSWDISTKCQWYFDGICILPNTFNG